MVEHAGHYLNICSGSNKVAMVALLRRRSQSTGVISIGGQVHDDSGLAIESGTKPRPKRHRRLQADEVAALVSAFQDGALINDLAQEFGIARTTVMKLLRKEEQPPRRGVMDARMPEAQDLRARGWSYAKIGKYFDLPASTVWYAFKSGRQSSAD